VFVDEAAEPVSALDGGDGWMQYPQSPSREVVP
jgi:hypothetical protein